MSPKLLDSEWRNDVWAEEKIKTFLGEEIRGDNGSNEGTSWNWARPRPYNQQLRIIVIIISAGMYWMFPMCQVLLHYFKPLLLSVMPLGHWYYSFATIIPTIEGNLFNWISYIIKKVIANWP